MNIKVIRNKLKELFKNKKNDYKYIQEEKSPEQNTEPVYELSFDIDSKEKVRDEKIFYYTRSADIISYEMKHSSGSLCEESFNYDPHTNIEEQIFFNALEKGFVENSEVLKNLAEIEGLIKTLEKLENEEFIKSQSSYLDEKIRLYNSNLQELSTVFPEIDEGTLKNLEINNSILPLPCFFDTRAVQIASHVPNQEGSYRRSQSSHEYYPTDKKGKKNELNKFGSNVADIIAEKGEAYSIGANATRVDKVIQYQSNGISSIKRNQPMLTLKDQILKHKTDVVRILVQNLENENKNFQCLNVNSNQLKAKYPCLIVTFKNKPDIPEGYSEFVTHMMIAQINLKLKENHLSPLIDRRQSFGFLTPSLTDVLTGVRLSLGLTPNEQWIKCVKEGIEQTDKALAQCTLDQDLLNKFRGGVFCGDGHKYLYSLFKTGEKTQKEVSDSLKKSKAKLDVKCKIYLSTKEITPHYKEQLKDDLLNRFYYFDSKNGKITIYDTEHIDGQSSKVNADIINYFLLKNFSSKDLIGLIEEQEDWLKEAINDAQGNESRHYIGQKYRILYNHITRLYKELTDVKKIGVEEQDLAKLTRNLITLQNKVVTSLLKATPLITEDTSDEDNENQYMHENFYSPAGMSALFVPLYAAAKVFHKNEDMPMSYGCDPYTYFELFLSWNKALDDKQFLRSDVVKEKFKNRAFKMLLENFTAVMGDSEVTICFKKIYYEIYNNQMEEKKLDDNAIIKTNLTDIKNFLEINIETDRKLKKELTEKELTEILKQGINIIQQSFPKYMDQGNVDSLENNPTVYYADNNPCVNKDNLEVRTAIEILNDLCNKEHCPKVFVLDTTSATEDQIDDFLNVFNKQDKIPILVTASSMVKHYEFGLDLWQGGINKACLSKKAQESENSKNEFTSFLNELKNVTKGTESGFSRYARRLVRETLNNIDGKIEHAQDNSANQNETSNPSSQSISSNAYSEESNRTERLTTNRGDEYVPLLTEQGLFKMQNGNLLKNKVNKNKNSIEEDKQPSCGTIIYD